MQLLVPPLDDRSADFKKEEDGSSTSNSATARSVMSQGLQDKFETMKQAWNHHSRASAKRSEGPAEASASSEDQDDAEQEEEEQHHQNKKRKVAMETAFAIEAEVQKWQRGIAELEAMLDVGDLDGPSSSAEDAENAARPPVIVRFPSLPPIIPAEEGDFDGSCSSEGGEEGIGGEGRSNKSYSTNPTALGAKVKVANTKKNSKK